MHTPADTYYKSIWDLDLRRELAWDPGKDAGLALAPVISLARTLEQLALWEWGPLMIPDFLFPLPSASHQWPGDHPDPGCFPAPEVRQPLTH